MQANVDLTTGQPLPGHEHAAECHGSFHMDLHAADMSVRLIMPLLSMQPFCALQAGSACQQVRRATAFATPSTAVLRFLAAPTPRP